MKFDTAAVASVLAGTAAARGSLSPSALQALTAIMPTSMLSGVASTFTKNMVNGGYGKSWSVFSGLSSRVVMTPKYSREVPGSQTVKLRYGPYTVPSMMKKNGLGEGGSLWNYPDTSITKPCEKCVIIGMTAGLEYTDGRSANIGKLSPIQIIRNPLLTTIQTLKPGCTTWLCSTSDPAASTKPAKTPTHRSPTQTSVARRRLASVCLRQETREPQLRSSTGPA